MKKIGMAESGGTIVELSVTEMAYLLRGMDAMEGAGFFRNMYNFNGEKDATNFLRAISVWAEAKFAVEKWKETLMSAEIALGLKFEDDETSIDSSCVGINEKHRFNPIAKAPQ